MYTLIMLTLIISGGASFKEKVVSIHQSEEACDAAQAIAVSDKGKYFPHHPQVVFLCRPGVSLP